MTMGGGGTFRLAEGFTNNLKAAGEDLGVDVLILSQSAKVDAGYVGAGLRMSCCVRLGGL